MRGPYDAAPRSGNERLDEILRDNCRHSCRGLNKEDLTWHCEHCPMVRLVDYVDELRGKDGC